MEGRRTNNPWVSGYAVFTAVGTLCLICAGGLVTSHEAGMAVPDWPTTYGYNMFFFPISKWIGGIFYEHTHRLIGAGVGLMTLILAGWLWWKEQRAWVRWLGLLALLVVIAQGVLGGLRVTEMMPRLGIFHAALAQVFLVLVAAIALFTSRWWVNAPQAPGQASALRRWYFWMSALIFLQLLVGATMRHRHAGLAILDFPLAYGQLWPDMSAEAIVRYNQVRTEVLHTNPITGFQVGLQMAHRVLALFILIGAVAVALKTQAQLGWRVNLTALSLMGVGLIVVQVVLGAATIWTNKSADIATAHVAVGALSFLVSVLLFLVASRGLSIGMALCFERTGPQPAGRIRPQGVADWRVAADGNVPGPEGIHPA